MVKPDAQTSEIFDRAVVSVLREIAEGELPGAGGCAAALSGALAAALIAMAARHDPASWDGAAGAIAQAETLRDRLTDLAHQDMEAHALAKQLLTAAEAPLGPANQERDRRLADALQAAAAAPAAIAEAAADTASLAAWAVAAGPATVRPDSLVAVHLAEAAAGAAAALVTANLGEGPESTHTTRATAAARAAQNSRTQADAANP